MYRSLILVASLLCLITPNLPGATVYVPDNYATIQQAITASSTGDTIIVRQGLNYVGDIDFLGKEITLRSEKGPATTVIIGSGNGPVVEIVGVGPNAVLEGFTIRGGAANEGSGIFCLDSSPTIRGNVITGNRGYSGGGIYCRHRSPVIEFNTIQANEAGLGGGICCVDAAPVITGNIISDCDFTPATGSGYGGAIHCLRCTVEVTMNHLTSNASTYGGAVFIQDSSGKISGNRLEGNRTDDVGTGSTYGGGICCISSDLLIARNRIKGNTCTSLDPSGFSCGGGIYITSGAKPSVEENLFEENLVTGSGSLGHGGGLYCDHGSEPTVRYNVFKRNRATLVGGGMACIDTSPWVLNNVFLANGSGRWGGGIACTTTGTITTPQIKSNTLAGNSAMQGGGIYCFSSDPVVVNCILWSNAVPQILPVTSTPSVSYCDVEGGYPGQGNIDADPGLVDLSGDDWHLTADSPCRERGTTATPGVTAFDVEGDPRVSVINIDIGADEFHTHLYCLGIATPGQSIRLGIVGKPGEAPVLLGVGAGLRNPPLATPYGEFHLLPPWHLLTLGAVPATGVLLRDLTVPAFWKPGDEHPLQALLGPTGGSKTRFTNVLLLPIE